METRLRSPPVGDVFLASAKHAVPTEETGELALIVIVLPMLVPVKLEIVVTGEVVTPLKYMGSPTTKVPVTALVNVMVGEPLATVPLKNPPAVRV